MFRLANPKEFLREYSESPKLKFKLAWLMIPGLAVPIALLMSGGLSEKYAVYLVLVAIVPFQYLMYSILRSRRREEAPNRVSADALMGILANQSSWLAAEEEWAQALRQKLTRETWERAFGNYLAEVSWHSLVLNSPRGVGPETLSSRLVLLFNAQEFPRNFMQQTLATEYISRVQRRGLGKISWRALPESEMFHVQSASRQLPIAEEVFPYTQAGAESIRQGLGR